jgi:DHA1 family tetracycline resistance protein-like MFS transporter
MKKNRILIVIFLTIFVDLLGFGILIPILPQLLANPASPFYLLPKGFSVKQGYIIFGFLTGIYPLMQFIATPILGQLSDRYGTSLSYVVFAFGIITKNLPLLFIARGFDGITGGNLSVAQAAIADSSAPEERARNFGLVGAAFGLGFILGPYLGGRLADPTTISWFSASTPFWFAAILAALNAISVIFFFPETLKHVRETSMHWAQSVTNIARAFNSKGVRTLYITNFLFQAGFTFYTTFFGVFLINKFNFTQGNIGDFFAYVGLWVAITQIFITRFLSRILREDEILRISLFGMAIFVMDYFVPSTAHGLLFVAPFLSIFVGLSMANSTALVSRSVDAKVQGEVLGISASVQALAQSIPPILSGFIAASLDPKTPIIVSAIVIAVGGLFFNIFYRRPKVASSLI